MSRRIERVNHVIREEICEVLQRQIRDPRLSNLVTVTEVFTSADIKHAKVYVSILGTEEEKKEAFDALNKASGFFHRELQEHLSLHHVPELSFYRDDSIEHGTQLLQLIKNVTDRENTNGVEGNNNVH